METLRYRSSTPPRLPEQSLDLSADRFETKNLIFRPLTEDDWIDVHKYASDPEVMKHLLWEPSTEEVSKDFVRVAMEMARQIPRLHWHFAIIQKSSGMMIGTVDIHIRNAEHNEGEYGQVLNRAFWGEGVGVEVKAGIINFGFDKLGLHRIYLTCDPRNAPAKTLNSKIPMENEGHLRQYRWAKGEWHDRFVFSILDVEWCRSRENWSFALDLTSSPYIQTAAPHLLEHRSAADGEQQAMTDRTSSKCTENQMEALRDRSATPPRFLEQSMDLAADRFETKNFICRPLNEADWIDVHKYASDPDAIKYLLWEPSTEEVSKEFVHMAMEVAREIPRVHWHFAVIQKASGKTIGTVEIHIRNADHNEGEIGQVFNRAFEGEGAGFEVRAGIINFGFEKLGLHRIYCTSDPENTSMLKLNSKLCMQQELHLRGYRWAKGKWHDRLLFSMLDFEWLARREDWPLRQD